MIFGTGFPAFRGGLLRYADQVGCTEVVETLDRLKSDLKTDRLASCGYLKDLARQGKGFYS